MGNALLAAGKERNEKKKKKSKQAGNALLAAGKERNERLQPKNLGGGLEGVAGGLAYGAGRLGVGLASTVEGITDVVAAAGDLIVGNPQQAKERFTNSVTGEWQEGLDEWYNPSKGMQVVGDVTGGVGQSFGYGLIAAIPYAGMPLMYGSIASQGVSSAAQKTGNLGLREVGYGLATGLVEGALETYLGAGVRGVKTLGSSILKKTGKDVVKSAAKEAGKGAVRTIAAETAKSFAGEFAEEAISEALDPALQRWFGIDKEARADIGSILYAGVIGGISGGIGGAITSGINYASAVSAGRYLQEKGLDGDLIKRAKSTLSGFEIANERAESMKVEKPTGDVKETKEEKKTRKEANKASKAISKTTKNLGAKIENNIKAYEQMRADLAKADSNAAAAVLGELRGNLFLLGQSFEIDTVEAFMKDSSDTERQAFVDAANEMMAGEGGTESYTLADFDENKNNIRRRLAGQLTFERAAEEVLKRRGATNATESPVEAAGEAQDLWAGIAEDADFEALGAASEAERAVETDPWEAVVGVEGFGTNNKQEEDLLRAAANQGVPKSTVPAMLTAYREGTDMTPAEFAEAWGDGVTYFGRYGLNEKAISRENGLARMSESARKSSIREGKKIADEETRRAQEKADKKKMPAQNEVDAKRKQTKGGSIIKGKGLIVNDLSQEQYTAYKAAEILSKVLGTDIVIEASMDSTAGRVTNGFYNRSTNSFHININAMRDGKSVALYTLGHEVTHYIKEWSPAKYKILSDFVMGKMGGDAKTLIDEKVSLLRSMEDYKDLTVAELNDLAAEEVVADGMELILTDGKVLNELANTDQSLWNKVKNWITDIISKIKKYYGELSGASKTAQVLRETMDSLDEIERIFTEAVQEAGERTRTAGVETVTGMNEGKMQVGDKVYSGGEVNNRKFTYNELVAKDDLVGIVIDKNQQVPLLADGNIDVQAVLKTVRSKCKTVSMKGGATIYYVNVPDIETNVRITGDGITHGFKAKRFNKHTGNSKITARATLELPELLKNSIEVNRLKTRNNTGVVFSRVMMGTVGMEDTAGNIDYYAVRMVVEERSDNEAVLVDLDITGNLYAAKAKKVGLQGHQGITKVNIPSGTAVAYTYNIAHFLDDVKGVFKNTFSNDVYQTLGVQREQDDFANDLLYSLGDAENGDVSENRDLTDREILGMALEGAVQSEQEYTIVKEYREQASMLDLVEERKKSYSKEASSLERQIKSLRSRMEEEGDPNGFIRKAMDEAIAKKRQAEAMRDEQERILDDATRKLASLRAAKPFRELISREQRRAKAAERKAAKAVEQAEAKVERANERADKQIQKEKERLKEQAEMSSERKEITARKRQAQRILNNLNTMLYHPTKAKHVPPLMQSLVDYALKRADPKQFGVNRDNIRTMAELAADIDKMKRKTTLTADEQERLYKMEAKYEALEADTLSVKRQAEALMTAFETWTKETMGDELVDENMLQGLRDTVNAIEEAPLHQMTLKSLVAVESLYKAIKHQVDYANTTFATEKKLDVDDMGREASIEVAKQKDSKLFTPKAGEWTAKAKAREFIWSNLKPLTAFEVIGSDKLMSLFRNILNGEDVWVTDVLEGKKVLDEAKKKYGYNKWDLTARSDVTTANGSTVSLTLGEQMSLYAYMFREQAEEHLSTGGFVLAPDAKVIRTLKDVKAFEGFLNDQTTYQMRREDIAKMAEGLTQEQKDYARDVQKYLTSLGKKGNEVSLKLYGMEIFNETDYFPIKSNRDYLKAQAGKTGDPQIKNRGTFQETTPGASNPIVLEDFMQVTSEHINTMAVYHAFTLPMEDLLRVWNYKPVNYKLDENGNVLLDDTGKPVADNEKEVQYNSLKAEITKKYGKKANEYILQLMRDLNGGARQDSATSLLDKGLTAFKRSATMLSLSTIIQQPTSIFRAMAYVDAKYFKGAKFYDYETVKKYAPVAAIKQIGGHDTGTGARTVEYLNSKEYDSQKEKLAAAVKPKLQGGDPNARAEYFGFLTEKADEIGWRYLFGACVNEQAAKLKKPASSEEVLKAAGERFADVVRRTQVYDSTLTRSEMMRSKSSAAKMVTAFGAEPATVVSMLVDAAVRAERGDKSFFRKTAGVLAVSIVINAMASSLIYAMRDDDEDENLLEKYVESLTGEIIEGFNPLEYLPYARDAMSLLKGYDVERSDMTLIGNLFDQIEMITSSKRSFSDKLFGVSGAVTAFFGIPVTNVYRDAKGAIKTALSFRDKEPVTGSGTGRAIVSGVKGQYNLFFKLFGAREGNAFELYRAALSGDTAHYDRVAARYETEKDAEMALRKELRENDRRITEAAQAKIDGELEVFESIVEQIADEGHFDRNLIIRAVNNEVLSIQDDAKKTTATKDDTVADEDEADESLYTYTDLADAIDREDTGDFETVYDYLLSYKMEQEGKTEAQAKSAVKSAVTSRYKKRYLEAWSKNDTDEMKRILALLVRTGLYGNRNDTAKTVEKWVRDANK